MDAQQLIASFRQSSPALSDELKGYLSFTKAPTGHDEEWVDPSAEVRMQTAKMLYGTAKNIDLPLLHFMIEQEAVYCSEIWGSTDALYYLAMTLFYLGEFSSLPVLWRCKNTSFDTYAVIRSRELFGAGIDETMTYLKNADFPEKDELVEYLGKELAAKPIEEAVSKLRNRLTEKFSAS